MRPPVFGIAGWQNSGKTTMAARLVTELTGRGYAITAIKHAHESFDIDHPGRDSELGGSTEMSFNDVLSEAGTCDLILVEGFKREPFPKIETAELGLWPTSSFTLHGSRAHPSRDEDG
jgi:molybdopterin-guanine dinucleotide biosynthesis protein B